MKTIDTDIKTANFKHIYLFYGEEAYLKKQYRDKLRNALTGEAAGISGGANDMNFTSFEGKDINPKEVIAMAETLPFFAERRMILIENSGFFKHSCDELAEYLLQLAPTTYLLFVEDEVDKRSRMYKTVKKEGTVTEFSTQTEELLTRWILSRIKKEGKNITAPVMRLFLGRTGLDMGNIDSELEKLLCYTLDKDVIEAEDVELLVTEQLTNRIFEMVNAIAEHNQKKALALYDDLLALKEPPMRIMYLITRQFHILLSIRNMAGKGLDQKTMAQKAGIPPFAVKRNLAQAKGFTPEGLLCALQEGVELEEAVKTGRMNDRLAVELFIMKYSAKH